MSQTSSNSKLVQGYTKAFVDSKVEADPTFSPQLLTNRGNQKVLTAIEKELKSCDDLFISVAGTLGIVGEVPDELDNANLTENADKLCDINMNKKFLLKVLQSQVIQKIILD